MDNNEFDELLSSLGFSDTTGDTVQIEPVASNTAVAIPNNQEISDEDLRAIMESNGIETSEEADAEEIVENSETSPARELNANDAIQTSEYTWDPGEAMERAYALMEEEINVVTAVPANAVDTHVQASSIQEVPFEETAATIPENSPTILLNEATSRFSGAEWYNEIQKKCIIIAGLGGIGSWTALNIARFNPERLVLYDPDTVETANMSGQFFCSEDLGDFKVNAVSRAISRYTSCYSVFCKHRRYDETSETSKIMICGFDNMEARKIFFRSWKNLVNNSSSGYKKTCLYIDGRLSIDTLQVFCITGDDMYNMDLYEKEYLFDDSEADATVCSLKQTSYMANMIGAFIANLLINFVANTSGAVLPYDVPFLTEYDAQNMIFKTMK